MRAKPTKWPVGWSCGTSPRILGKSPPEDLGSRALCRVLTTC
jgi:hypothetical protein